MHGGDLEIVPHFKNRRRMFYSPGTMSGLPPTKKKRSTETENKHRTRASAKKRRKAKRDGDGEGESTRMNMRSSGIVSISVSVSILAERAQVRKAKQSKANTRRRYSRLRSWRRSRRHKNDTIRQANRNSQLAIRSPTLICMQERGREREEGSVGN